MKKSSRLFIIVVLLSVVCLFYVSKRCFSSTSRDAFSSHNVHFERAAPTKIVSKFESIQVPSVNLKPMFQHEYKGTLLSSSPIKTEIVSAFFDFRENRQLLVILGCQFQQSHYYCLVKYPDGNEKCLAKETRNEHLSKSDVNKSKNCWSHRFTCELESIDTLPTHIALTVSSSCKPPRTKWMSILDSKYEKYTPNTTQVKQLTLGVCFQSPLYLASKWKGEVIVEAVERYRALGAEWFTLYFRENPSEEVMQVIREYETQGILEAINLTLSDATFYDLRYYGELLSIRDCVYRNMYRAKYLAMTDIDEVIVPQSHTSLANMISFIDSSAIGAFKFKHSAMLIKPGEDIDEKHACPDQNKKVDQPMFLTHTYRTNPFPIPETDRITRTKVIVKPQAVDLLSIHTVGKLLRGYNVEFVNPSTGLLYHYRHTPFFNPEKCSSSCSKDNKLSSNSVLVNNYFTMVCLISGQ